MNKNVIISVKGTQSADNSDPNKLELVTEGKYYKKGNTYFVTYKESNLTGMDGTTTTLKITDDGTVTLMRFGSVNSQFVFQQGQRHLSYYDTTYGTFTVCVLTNQVNVDVNDSGGDVNVDYLLEVDNNKSGYNDFRMNIREAEVSGEDYSADSIITPDSTVEANCTVKPHCSQKPSFTCVSGN